MASAPRPKLEGDDPPPEDDDILSVIPLDHRVSDEEAEDAITDCLGGGAHRYHAQVIIKRFARERWRITKEG